MFSKNLARYFPPPDFLNTPYAGLSMSDKHIRVIQFGRGGKKGLYIKKYAELPLPLGAITDGRVNNKDQIVAVLKELKQKTGIQYVRVSVPEEKAYLFELEIPLVEPHEIKSAIEFKIEENVPWPADKVVFDYVIVEKNEKEGHIRVVVSALPSKFVDIYMDLFNSSELTPYVFEIESQAIARALLEPHEVDTYLMAHFHKDKVGICIVSGGVVHFTSTLNPSEKWYDNPSLIATEIRKIISYWQSTKADSGNKKIIQRIYISGDVADDSIVSLLFSVLKIEVVLGNVWKNVLDVDEELPDIPFFHSLRYAPAVGLALPSDSLI